MQMLKKPNLKIFISSFFYPHLNIQQLHFTYLGVKEIIIDLDMALSYISGSQYVYMHWSQKSSPKYLVVLSIVQCQQMMVKCIAGVIMMKGSWEMGPSTQENCRNCVLLCKYALLFSLRHEISFFLFFLFFVGDTTFSVFVVVVDQFMEFMKIREIQAAKNTSCSNVPLHRFMSFTGSTELTIIELSLLE